eukprot:78456_1
MANIRVVFETGQPDVVISVAKNENPVAYLKWKIYQTVGWPPVDQRLQLLAETDKFNVYNDVICKRRTRNPNTSVTIFSKNSDEYDVLVDVEDSVLDLKFLLSEITQAPPESIRLWVNSALLPDNQTLQSCGVFSADVRLTVQYFFPSKEDGHGDIHRTVPTLCTDADGIQSLCDNFRKSVEKWSNNKCLGWRSFRSNGTRGSYKWMTYAEAGRRVSNIAAGLVRLGLRKGNAIGLMAVNRPEWQLVDTACWTQSFVSVPLYDTLGPNVAKFILNHSDIVALVTSSDNVDQIVKLKDECPKLKFIIVMDDAPEENKYVASGRSSGSAGFTHSLSEIEMDGKDNPCPDNCPAGDDIATISYTSGTTGNPKGVILTHKCLILASEALRIRAGEQEKDGTQLFFSYLTLAHIYGRVMEIFCFRGGYSIGYFQGDITKLVDDVSQLAPTIFSGVPRVWQRVYDKIMSELSNASPLKQWIFNQAFDAQISRLSDGKERSGLWDKLVFDKIAAKFGGQLEVFSNGAAPISAKVVNFLRVVLKAEFAEGYGLTETSAIMCTTVRDESIYGHVGTPSCIAEVKLVSVPEMDYNVTDVPEPRGEIWCRGPSLFKGYFKAPDLTEKALSNGWFQTGDIGKWRPDGNLQIIDRKKNIFKLSQGEYIRPEYIEGVYKMNKFVANIFVYGDSLRSFVVAIVVPDFEALEVWAVENNLKSIAKNPAELCVHPAVIALFKSELRKTGEAEGLMGFEHCKAFTLVPDDFTVESGLLTPSMKLKRYQAKKIFATEIEAMYNKSKL